MNILEKIPGLLDIDTMLTFPLEFHSHFIEYSFVFVLFCRSCDCWGGRGENTFLQGREPLQSCLEALPSLLDLDYFDFFFFEDLPISLTTVSVAVKVLPFSGTVSPSQPSWSVRREVRFGAN